MNLTKNFTLEEMIKSETALRHGMDNTPGEKEIGNLKVLCEKVLQPVRDHFGRVLRSTPDLGTQTLMPRSEEVARRITPEGKPQILRFPAFPTRN